MTDLVSRGLIPRPDFQCCGECDMKSGCRIARHCAKHPPIETRWVATADAPASCRCGSAAECQAPGRPQCAHPLPAHSWIFELGNIAFALEDSVTAGDAPRAQRHIEQLRAHVARLQRAAPAPGAGPDLQSVRREPWREEVVALIEFGHHADPAIDFCLEVERIEAEIRDQVAGAAPQFNVSARIQRAMEFRVGGDPRAVKAKASLRRLESKTTGGAGPESRSRE